MGSKIFRPRVAAVSAGALVLAGLGTTTAQAEGGDQRNCVTYGEFARVDKADRMRSVMRLFDSRGRRVSTSRFRGMKDQTREWNPCPGSKRFGSVIVNFDDYTYGSTRRGGPMEATYKDMSVFW